MKKIYRLPTILGLLLLLLTVAGGLILIRQGSTFLLRASPEIIPQQVKTTNVADDGFTISWITDDQTSGFVKYGPDINSALVAADDRDQLSGKTGNFFTHHVTLKSLNPATNYYFKIGSGKKIFDNNGQPYQLKTAPSLQTTSPPNDVAYGVVVDENDLPVQGVIVYLSLANATTLSALTKSSGNWAIPLNLARSGDLSSYAPYDREASVEEIFAQGGPAGTATVIATTKNDSPLPKILLGQSFDFRRMAETDFEAPEKPEALIQTQAVGKFDLQAIAASPPAGEPIKLEIINPEANEAVNTPKPEIIGRGPIGADLSITIESPVSYSDTIQVDSQGSWQWTAPADLEPGKHTVTVSYLGQKISRTFTVLAAETSNFPALTASPSGTITPSLSPSPTLSPSPSPSPVVSPAISPTVSPTLIPTRTPTPTGKISPPSTEEAIPTSGYLNPTFLVFIIGAIFMSLGWLVGLFRKKTSTG